MESQPAPSPSDTPVTAVDPRTVRGVLLSPGEFLWVTLAVWLCGVFILTLMPVFLIPRFGMPLGVAGSYLVFFLAWQPIQSISQRSFGHKAGVVRMLIFVGGAATAAFYLREALAGQ